MNRNETVLIGKALNKGIAIGRISFYDQRYREKQRSIASKKRPIDEEITRYRKALLSSREDLSQLQTSLASTGSTEAANIVHAHLQMLDDPLLTTDMEEKIRITKQDSESAISETLTEYRSRFSKQANQFFQDRLNDIIDLAQQVIHHLNVPSECFHNTSECSGIIFSKDFTAMKMARLNPKNINGFITSSNHETSHAVLIAKSHHLPFITDIDINNQLCEGSIVIIDGNCDKVILSPSETTLKEYQELLENQKHQLCIKRKWQNVRPVTADQLTCYVRVNLSSLWDIEHLDQHSSLDVGLVRTECFFTDEVSDLSAKRQASIYQYIVDKVGDRIITWRLFDYGGDKHPPFSQDQKKQTFSRGAAWLLDHKPLLRDQIHALNQVFSSKHRILIPMVETVSQLEEITSIIVDEWEGEIPRIGSMIETPESLCQTDLIFSKSDFFSIGTNDLAPLLAGKNREFGTYEEILNTSRNPELFRQLSLCEKKFSKKEISICGDIASNPLFIPLLLGLGFHTFSTALGELGSIKFVLSHCEKKNVDSLALRVLNASNEEQVYHYLLEWQQKFLPAQIHNIAD